MKKLKPCNCEAHKELRKYKFNLKKFLKLAKEVKEIFEKEKV